MRVYLQLYVIICHYSVLHATTRYNLQLLPWTRPLRHMMQLRDYNSIGQDMTQFHSTLLSLASLYGHVQMPCISIGQCPPADVNNNNVTSLYT